MGVFARVRLAIGDRLRVIGVLIQANSPADRCTAFADHHKFCLGDALLIPLGYGGMVNHSMTPNMVKVVEGDDLYLEVIRAVEVGEELFHCYRTSARERFGLC